MSTRPDPGPDRRRHRGDRRQRRRADPARPGDRRRRPRQQHGAAASRRSRRSARRWRRWSSARRCRRPGMILVTTVGGASGPLYGSLLMGIGKGLQGRQGPGRGVRRGRGEREEARQVGRRREDHARRAGAGARCVCARSRRDAGRAAQRSPPPSREATKPMLATRGRASFLGERSIGHYDPGATSTCLLIHAVCDVLEGRGMSGIVGIVIVSHSPKVAEGAADMVRQMVGDEVPCAWTGGNPVGGLGTDAVQDPRRHRAGLERGRRGRAGRSRRGRDERRDGDRDAAAGDRRPGCGSATRRSSRVRSSAATEASGGATARGGLRRRRGAGPVTARARRGR